MVDFRVRGLKDETIRRLTIRAEANGRSFNDEVLAILADELSKPKAETGSGSREKKPVPPHP